MHACFCVKCSVIYCLHEREAGVGDEHREVSVTLCDAVPLTGRHSACVCDTVHAQPASHHYDFIFKNEITVATISEGSGNGKNERS